MSELCVYCGEEELIDVFELWTEDRSFMLETCCEALYPVALMEFEALDRRDRGRFVQSRTNVATRTVAPSSLGAYTLDYGLSVGPVTLSEAKAFVRAHHRHNPPPVGWRWGYGIRNGAELVGVAMIGRPVARAFDPATVVEVNRVCVRDLDPRELVWNACSQVYAEAAREARRRGFKRILTYTLETEQATALRAVGWIPAATTRGGSWNRPSRPRTDKAPTVKKVRWEKAL